MATIRDVAREAGVSVATVSRVLNEEHVVSPKTVSRVREAMHRLHYTPNMLGTHLRRKSTNDILVLIPNTSNQIYNRILRGIQTEAQQRGYNVMVCPTGADRAMEERYLTLLKTKLADGAIFLSSTLSAQEMNRLARSFPVVQCCERIPGSATSFVSVRNEEAGYDAVSALIAKGHRKIAFLGSSQGVLSSEEREQGYRRALSGHGIPLCEAYLVRDTYSYNSGMRSAEKLLALPDRPTAIFAVADTVALGALRFLLSHGVRIPEDIAVIGFDDISFSAVYTPSLSTVSQPQLALGEHAMQLLAEKLQNPQVPDRTVLLPHRLLLRETV